MKNILLIISILLMNVVKAQNTIQSGLKIENDGNWIEYSIPDFMKNITPEDNGSPHFFEYNFESQDKDVIISILVNNSSKYRFDLKGSFQGKLKSKDAKITYKSIKVDRYFISCELKNGRILYEFCLVKNGYGYTYSIEYERSYSEFFNKNIPEIIKNFKILF